MIIASRVVRSTTAGLFLLTAMLFDFQASAFWCQDPSTGLRTGCDSADTSCEGDVRARYHTYETANVYLQNLDSDFDSDDHMRIIDLGDAANHGIFTVGTALLADVLVVRIAENAESHAIEHPPILLVASIHPNEWIASELALSYVDYLVKGANSGDAAVAALLQETEFWVVVNANPAARSWDDIPTEDNKAGNPDYKLNNQRKNLQWETGFDAESFSDTAEYSGFCDFGWTGELGSDGIDVWDDWGVNLARNFSTEWPSRGTVTYPRTAMLEDLVPASTTDYAGAGEIAPEMYECDGNDTRCADLFSDHPKCVQRGMNGVLAQWGCFMADPRGGDYDEDSLAACEDYVATHDVTDELGITHVCLKTLIVPGTFPVPNDYDYLLWECGASGAVQDSIALFRDASFGGDLLSTCENGVLTSCRTDTDCDDGIIDDNDFASLSVHRHGQRYCDYVPATLTTPASGSMFCAIGESNTPCHGDYRGQRPFETIEARLIRTLADNVPFAFAVDMHSSRNDLTSACKNMGDGCVPGNDERVRHDELRAAMINEYNNGVDAAGPHWLAYAGAGTVPLMLQLRDGGRYRVNRGAGQLPPWLSSLPATTVWDPTITMANFDAGTYRGITSFTWETGVPQNDNYWQFVVYTDSFGNPVDDSELFDAIIRCESSTERTWGGSAPRASLLLENQFAGMKTMMAYLASQAETPNVAPPTGGIVAPKRDLSLVGLRIHDGHGRGVQQIETRPEEIGEDPTAVTVVPAGIWFVGVDAVAGSNLLGTVLTGDVELRQSRPSLFLGGLWQTVASEVESVTVDGGGRRTVTRGFEFEPGVVYRIEAEVTGPDACVGATCAAANDLLVAKIRAVDCDDLAEIPNGLDPDLFCGIGIPFDNAEFECDDANGRCRECWYEPLNQQECEGVSAFCFEGMCDDVETCWSGTFVDELEGANRNETSPTITPDDPPYVRTLRLKDSPGALIQDVDTFKTATTYSHAAGDSPPTMYHLKVVVRNLCEEGVFFPGANVRGLDVRVQVRLPWATYPYTDDSDYSNLTVSGNEGWVAISRADGLELEIPAGWSAGVNSDKHFRIQVRNREAALESIPYSVDIEMDDSGGFIGMLYPKTKVWPWDEIVWPTADVNVDIAAGEVRSFVPTDDGIWGGYSLFFSPAAGYENAVGVTQFLLSTQDGGAPSDPNGVPLAPTVNRDGGLAVQLGALDPQSGPYQVRLATDAERIEGRVFLCGPNVADCSAYSPRTEACGSACTGDGALCCADEDRNLSCKFVHGSDVTNCGGCGVTCDWDEKCLNGVCVTGRATSCWNTTCPEGMECVSRDWPLLRNPQCRGTLVDNAWCGLLGDVCVENESCTYGLCLPKTFSPCDLPCGDGEACCWVMGEETCADVQGDSLNCGACGNACGAGTLCADGLCESWYHVLDVCAGDGVVNCGVEGIECVDVFNDPENCGGCGIPCPDTGWCEDGVCTVETQEVHYDD